MALEGSLLAIKDFVTDTTLATWPDVTVTHEDPRMRNQAPVAWIRPQAVSFEPVTLQSDEATVTVTVHGRFASLTTADKAERASQLRAALVALGSSLDGVAYRVDVSEFEGYSETDVLDPASDIGLLFLCRVKVPRT